MQEESGGAGYVTVGMFVAKTTLEAAASQEGHGVRLSTFEQTVAGWVA
jgi:hypothetical protein